MAFRASLTKEGGSKSDDGSGHDRVERAMSGIGIQRHTLDAISVPIDRQPSPMSPSYDHDPNDER